MTPDDIQRISQAVAAAISPTLVDVNSKLGEVDRQLGIVVTKQEAHEELHEVHALNRSLTCPTAPLLQETLMTMNSLANNVNALAGIQRDHHDRLVLLEAADKVEKETALVVKERLRPVKWVVGNVDKVLWALVAAFTIAYFIEKFLEK